MKTFFANAQVVGRVVLKTTEIGEPSPNELLLRAEFSSMSPGTERSLMAGHILPLPQPIGYSLAATVVGVGRSVVEYEPGDRVVATARHANFQVVDERLVTPVPEGTDMEQAAFFNLAHTALYGIRRCRLQIGEPALIMGQGLVGALTARLARIAGAAPVIVTDVNDTRLEMAAKLGAHFAINSESQPGRLAQIVDELGLDGIPVVLDTTGLRQPLEQAVELVGERGRIMLMASVQDDISSEVTQRLMMKGAVLIGGYVNSKPFALHRTDLTIAGAWPPVIADGSERYANRDAWTSDEDIRAVLALMRHGTLDAGPLITHRFAADEIPGAYDLVWNREPSLLGGVIDWRSEDRD